jgi:hypothetical protein
VEHPEGLSRWIDDLARGLPVLTAARRRVLAQWCFAMEQTGLCGTQTPALILGLALQPIREVIVRGGVCDR